MLHVVKHIVISIILAYLVGLNYAQIRKRYPPPPPPAKVASPSPKVAVAAGTGGRPSCPTPPQVFDVMYTLVSREDWADKSLATFDEALRIKNYKSSISSCSGYDAAKNYVNHVWSKDYVVCYHGVHQGEPCAKAYLLRPVTLITPTNKDIGALDNVACCTAL